MDREKAIKVLKRCEAEPYCSHYKRHFCCIGCGQRDALDLAIEALKQTEIVRCKDCRHSQIEGDTTIFLWCGYWNKPTDGIRYCSDGERSK